MMYLIRMCRGFPSPERSFRMMYTSPANYDATLKLIRNIIIADVQDIYTQPKFKYAKDVYAAPQTILTIQALMKLLSSSL